MLLSDFDYELPASLIAKHPLPHRDHSRLMLVNGNEQQITSIFALPEHLQEGSIIVFNDSKVWPACIHAKKESGGKVEILVENVDEVSNIFTALVKASRRPQIGSTLIVQGIRLSIISDDGILMCLAPSQGINVINFIRAYGSIPLPPYLKRDLVPEDLQRYQTVFAHQEGSSAAPTAGLHFTQKLIDNLSAAGIKVAFLTLHVGIGTFLPVRNKIENHKMHSEPFSIPEKTAQEIWNTREQGKSVIACGTTVLRALETMGGKGEFLKGETNIFIKPGFRFQVVDMLLTNFHLPKSTLLMLVYAFGGINVIKQAYQRAIDEKFRFYSYGDAMLIKR